MGGRSFTRVSYTAGAAIQFGNETAMCKTDNLSLRGMYLKTEINIPLDIPVQVTVFHCGLSYIKVNARVVRKEANGIGLQISSMLADSFAQLRDIVAQNSRDPGMVMKETFGMLECIN
ncbi:MAG: PilZ domain-containing protein [Deltaproteobacteria bacterium]|jgi:hypothetical protein|nr:PilZ domain-containing protein [Deltaproteobacteria bacterium]